MKEKEHPGRTWEGGLLAIIAGVLVWWLDDVLYQLVNVLLMVYGPAPLRLDGASLAGLLQTFVLRIPPAYAWQHFFMVGGVVGVLAFWIHTSRAPAEKQKLWRWYLHLAIVMFYFFYTTVGHIQQGGPLWAVAKLTAQTYGILFLCLWILWRLMPLVDRVQMYLDSQQTPQRRYW